MSYITPNVVYSSSTGTTGTGPFVEVFLPRNPTSTDLNGNGAAFQVQQRWWNTETNDEFVLTGFYCTEGKVYANWEAVGSGSISAESFIVQSGTSPVDPDGSGNITFNGTTAAAGTTPVQTVGGTNTMSVAVQTSQAIAATDATKIGLSAFDSASFGVDANGFVTLKGGTQAIDSFIPDSGTSPVVPAADGSVTITATTAPAGTTPIQTVGSLNSLSIQAQVSQAIASSEITNVGVCAFNSADFTVDSDGFVSALSSTFTREVEVDANSAPGTDPVVPTAGGVITVTGGQVAAGTTANVIQTNSLAANTYTIQVQRSQAVASSTVGDNGVCHFSSDDFIVDSNGFVEVSSTSHPTFTPVIAGSTSPGTATYISQNGAYSKIGAIVVAQIDLEWTGHTGTGDMLITGFPFIFAAANSFYPAATIMNGIAYPANTLWVCIDGTNNTTQAEVKAMTSATTLANVQMSAAGNLACCMVYLTDA